MRRRAVIATLGLVVLAILLALAWLVLRDDAAELGTDASTDTVVTEVAENGDLDRQRMHRGAAEPETADTEPAPAQPAWTGPVATGRVVDADGAPVAGARIVSHPDDVEGSLAAENIGTEGSRSFVGTSDDDGRFELPIDPDGVSVVLTATADAGFGQVAVTPRDRKAEIVLVPWLTLTGRVTDTDGRPVTRATLRMHLLIDAVVGTRTVATDESGDYEITQVPPLGWGRGLAYVGTGLHGWLIAQAEGFAPLLVGCDAKATNDDDGRVTLDLTLVRGITLKGTVVDGDTKQPVPGATVVCWSVEGMQSFVGAAGVGRGNPVGPRSLGTATTAEDGGFVFPHLPAMGPSGVASHNMGKRGMTLGHVAAWKDGYVFGGDEIPVSPDGETLTSTIELWPLATIEGRVVDVEGTPLEGVSVHVSVPERRPALNGFPELWDEKPTPWPKTDADGQYQLRMLRASRNAPTTGSLTASLRVGAAWVNAESIDITAMAGETIAAPDLVLDVGAVARAVFVVADDAGNPLPGASVGTPPRTSRSDMQGRCEWAPQARLGRGSESSVQTVTVRAAGFAPRTVEFTPGLGKAVEVQVRMEPGRRITGRVAAADGRAVEGARVHVVDGNKPVGEVFRDGQMFMAFTLGGRSAALLHYASSNVAADGSFVVEDLPDGPYHVAAEMSSRAPSGPGRPPDVLRDIRSGVAAGADDIVLTIPADDAPPTHPLELIVTDAGGATIESCSAFAVFGGPRIYAQPAGPGRLRFAALPAGEGRIDVSAAGYRPGVIQPVVIDPDLAPEPMTAVLDRGVVLRGTVSAAAGNLPTQAFVMLRPTRGDGWTGTLTGLIAADGTYEVGGLAPGTYLITVNEHRGPRDTTSYVPERDRTVTIGEEAPVERNLVVSLAGEVRIHLRDERFAPSPLMGGNATPEQKRASAESRIEIIDASGTVVLTFAPVFTGISLNAALARGDHVIRLHTPGAPPTDKNITVRAGETASATFSDK